MPKETKNPTNYAAQTSKYLNGESANDLLAAVDQLIENVYRDLSTMSNHVQGRRSFNDNSSPNGSPIRATSVSILSSGDESGNSVSPSTRMNMDAEIERINRVCDTVDRNLRSVGVLMNTSGSTSSSEDRLNTNITNSPPSAANLISDLYLENTPQRTTASPNFETRSPSRCEPTVADIPLIDLSETQSQTSLLLENNRNNGNDDDDVILVSANINPVVNLCTPGDHNETSRRRRSAIDYSDLNRRCLPVPDVEIVDTYKVEGCSTVGRCRTSNKRKSLDILFTETEKNENDKKSPYAGNTASGSIPYMCSVCMESCLQRQPTSTKCGHIFCNQCIRQAVHITRKCPLCNTKISRNHIFRIYP